jgi:hypothetical protein
MKQAWYIAENDDLECTVRDAADHDEDGDGMVCEQATPKDARLIAAAPDLLAAAERALAFLPEFGGASIELQAAIDKANGTSFDCVDGEHGCYNADQPCGCPCDNCHDDTEFRCKVCNTMIDTQMSAMLTSRSLEICEDCQGGE